MTVVRKWPKKSLLQLYPALKMTDGTELQLHQHTLKMRPILQFCSVCAEGLDCKECVYLKVFSLVALVE